MTEFPFPSNTIKNHRFHGVLQGVFDTENGIIRLQTAFGLVRLYPRPGKSGKRPFRAAYRNHEAFPDAVLNVYGYPRTSDAGIVERLEMVSFHVSGSPEPDGPLPMSRKFQPNQLFLCGRVRQLKEGLIQVKVKSTIGDRDLSWRVTGMLAGFSPSMHSKVLCECGLATNGMLVVRPLEVITPAGRSTSSGDPAGTRFSRTALRYPDRSTVSPKRSDSHRQLSQRQR